MRGSRRLPRPSGSFSGRRGWAWPRSTGSSATAVLGGIYGRPTVFANLILTFVGTMSLAGAGVGVGVAVVLGGLAAAWGALLFRGPFGDRPASS